jgi:hypothetical protein
MATEKRNPLEAWTWSDEGINVHVIETCEVCGSSDVSVLSIPEQGISCAGCGIALCHECFEDSKVYGGTVGDRNDQFENPIDLENVDKPTRDRVMGHPWAGYFPVNYGHFGQLRLCLRCSTPERVREVKMRDEQLGNKSSC